ncbi:2-oxoglutarate dehydrogenase E1 component [Herbaspirillum lusitanum]|uniref:2-oxoglutarate dehydrogenase E1 component n=1 Tax=Herbaspirillum lusitanum TaxID=213312 RepID=UPI00223893AD|nr:2-oxoglutarate dehydrogenase E1 component [Herbaspirillum lusitanum]MCW5298269.1 2-oxoglutarate dehydrogenase E1 component [Herbaspirillum lusitanum]
MSNNYPEHLALERFSFLPDREPAAADAAALSSWYIAQFIEAHRNLGHRMARLDPLAIAAPDVTPTPRELTPEFYGLAPAMARPSGSTVFPAASTVQQLDRQLKEVYCGAFALDCSGIRDESRRAWLFSRMEASSSTLPSAAQRQTILRRLLTAEVWERHLAATAPHAKRFSMEGCESLLPLMDMLIENAAQHGVQQMFLGLPHRGRLNMLVNLMDFPVQHILACLNHDSPEAISQNDLPFHLGGSALKQTSKGEVSVFLAHNPSHLQSVYPVVSGMARAFQDDNPESGCVPVMVHGDAAFAGQGIVMETLNLTRAQGYTLGGTVHIIVNNQIAFTTSNAMDVAGNLYCTDIGRLVDAPVIRVNADHPDDLVRAAAIAFEYRMKYGADVIIDLIGYRRLGHSEHDIPALTHPRLQAAIARHPPVTELYHACLAREAARTSTSISLDSLRTDILRSVLTSSPHGKAAMQMLPAIDDNAASLFSQPPSLERLQTLAAIITTPPEDFKAHNVIRQLIQKWQAGAADARNPVDWCFAENLACASLLGDGVDIRLSGLDVGHGTFMHRHARWFAQDDIGHHAGEAFIPLDHIGAGQGRFDIVNSPLTEEAVLGFEYGYSVQAQRRLTIWEAQFGDFVNGAQVIVDQYIAPGEHKWGYRSGLTMLLPHGQEGAGPEHSTAYLGRFLQLCADRNMRIAFPSTSAQWFHLLRQQAVAEDPKPLVVMSPKSHLYGNPRSHSSLQEMTEGGFKPLLADRDVTDSTAVERVILCSGKFFYDIDAARNEAHDARTAVIRIEQLYPFPQDALAEALAAFPHLSEVVWAQEEDKNQGAWRFVRDALEESLPTGIALRNVCRTATAAGAHSSLRRHQQEQRRLVAEALGGKQQA